MNAALTGIIVTFLLTVLLAYPLGKYIAKIFGKQPGEKNYINGFEKFIFRISGIDPKRNELETVSESHAYYQYAMVGICFFHADLPG